MTGYVSPVKALIALAVMTSAAHADTRVDWARGLVLADGISVADRHAPSPAVARGTARRVAEDQAKKAIAAELGKLPLASGGKVADRAGDAQVKARRERAVAAAIAVAAEPQTDGGWNVTMAVPIEAVRQAISGPRPLPPQGDTGPSVVVVEGAAGRPAIGWKVGGVEAATIWPADVPELAKAAEHVHAKSAKAGAIELDRTIGTASTLYVILAR
jgi:hypothetical protein